MECANKRAIEEFEKRVDEAYSNMMSSLQRYKLQSVRAEKIWGLFHKFSLQEGLRLCKICNKTVQLKAHDIFWQLLLEKKLFSRFVGSTTDTQTHTSGNRNLNSIEENAIHYTSGYVVKKLISKYSRTTAGPNAATYLLLLKQMGSKLSESRSSVSCCSEWTKLVDRGGLFHVNNSVYDLFVYLEMTVDKELTAIFNSKGKGIEKVRKEKLDWLCNNDEVQLVWSMISTLDDDDDDLEQDLLREIASLWITIRGYSKARKIKEKYKREKATATKGKRSLRKELKRQDTSSTS